MARKATSAGSDGSDRGAYRGNLAVNLADVMAEDLTKITFLTGSVTIDWDAAMARTMLELFGMDARIHESLQPDEFQLVDQNGRAVAGYRDGRMWTAC